MVSVLFYEMKQTSEVDSRNVEYVFCCFYSFSVESQSVVSLSEEGHSYVEKKTKTKDKTFRESKALKWPNPQSGIFFTKSNVRASSPSIGPGKTTKDKVHDDISMVKKNSLTTSKEVKNIIREGGVSVSRSLHKWKWRGFTTRRKPLVTLKSKRAGLD